jgi:hypothetical protein
MTIHSRERGDTSLAGRPRGLRWLMAAGVLVVPVLSLQAAAPPLENSRSVDRMIIPARGPETESAPASETPAVASRSTTTSDLSSHRLANRANPAATGEARAVEAIAQARKAVADCQERYRHVRDYMCTFIKRERIDERLTPPHIMMMKARTNPNSVYFKFQQPNRGREAIYVHGRNNGRVLAHDVGLGKLFGGTMHLDPHGMMAMEDNRHPVTEAGIGNLIESVARHWAVELSPGESILTFHNGARVGDRACTMIESIHPQRGSNFLFHKVKLYIDQEHGLPIRFEAYDWPRKLGAAPELVEEYTYLDLKLNVGLHDRDFDPANVQYSFGRF